MTRERQPIPADDSSSVRHLPQEEHTVIGEGEYPDLEFMQECILQRVVSSASQDPSTLEITGYMDMDRFNGILEKYQPLFDKYQTVTLQNRQEVSSVVDFDWEQRFQQGMDEARGYFKSANTKRRWGLDINRFRETSPAFAHRAIVFRQDQDYAQLLPEMIVMGGVVVLDVAVDLLLRAQEIGVEMSKSQALQAAIVGICAHELAHDIDETLGKMKTFEAAEQLTENWFFTIPVTDGWREGVHQERFARAIGEMIEREYMVDKLGMDRKNVEKIFKQKHKHETAHAETARIRSYAIHTSDLYVYTEVISRALRERYGDLVGSIVPNYYAILAYQLPPYGNGAIDAILQKVNKSQKVKRPRKGAVS